MSGPKTADKDKTKVNISDNHKIVDFLYEVGMLQKTPRSGFQFLGSGNQSVAEHLHRVTIIALVIAVIMKVKNPYKVGAMASVHDIAESRTSDPNYVHQKYLTRLEEKAHHDIVESFPLGYFFKELIDEYEERKTVESKIVKDADTLEWILSLKEQQDIGNKRAEEWIPSAIARLHFDVSKEIAKAILEVRSDHWWFGDPSDGWWVYRSKDIKK